MLSLLEVIELIRGIAARMIGLVQDEHRARFESPAVPLLSIVSPPKSYVSFTDHRKITADDVDLVARVFYMQEMHKTYSVTATVCTGAAAMVAGTVVNQVTSPDVQVTKTVRLGHPSGVIPIEVEVDNDPRGGAGEGRLGEDIAADHGGVRLRPGKPLFHQLTKGPPAPEAYHPGEEPRLRGLRLGKGPSCGPRADAGPSWLGATARSTKGVHPHGDRRDTRRPGPPDLWQLLHAESRQPTGLYRLRPSPSRQRVHRGRTTVRELPSVEGDDLLHLRARLGVRGRRGYG